MRHNRNMPVADCFEERRVSKSVSVVDIGLCARVRQERLGHRHISTRSGLKQLGSSIVTVLFRSISTSTIRIGHTFWNGMLVVLNDKKLRHLRDVIHHLRDVVMDGKKLNHLRIKMR
jgi:hypothetical protein